MFFFLRVVQWAQFLCPPNPYVEIQIPKVVQGETLMNKVSALRKRPQRNPLPIPPSEVTAKRCSLGSRPSPDTGFASAFVLDFPASRTVTNLFVYELPSLWHSVIAAGMD